MKTVTSFAKDEQQGANIKTLPARWYHDPATYEIERKNIFFSEWLLYAHEALFETPGSYMACTIAGWPVFVIRGKDGTLKGFHNVCRHRASMVLREGRGRTDILRCMYHGWVYDTEGCLRKTPGFGGDEQDLCGRTSLAPLHVKTWNGLVFICLNGENAAPSFEKALGDLPEAAKSVDFSAYKFFDTASHTINCNWKTYVENYMEGYHIPAVHPELNKEIDFPTYKVVPGDRIARHIVGTRTPDAINDGLWVWLWPHVALNIYRNGMNLELVMPTGPETTELRYCYLFRDLSPESEEANRKTIAMSFSVTQEDIDICEIVQKNLRAGIYDRGELSPRHENGVAYFQSLVAKAVEAG